MNNQLIMFEPMDVADGPLAIRAEDVHHVTKAPNRRTAARVWYYSDGRQEYFDTKLTPEEATAVVNTYLAAP